ncbi:hypothetical protein EJB05_00810 [Eragrostis curvula]|uniref:DUF1618 domain-containing protein n=1 Tax=Eragrostis curvula TaxID=38414 RepID=A0A5J9WNM4_9POAL|nr:hypothetical protein EJB05_00810 [Eragrostis curvula]
MPSPAQERWTILAGIPKVVGDEEAGGMSPLGTTIAVDCNDPPCASVLTVPRRVSSAPTTISYPYVAAADPSGLILLSATQPHSNLSTMVSYRLCDAPTGKSVGIPRHNRPMGLHGSNAGLIRRDRDFMIAELRPTHDGSGRATLLCFRAGKHEWTVKELAYSPPLHRRFFGEGVVSHAGMLWWVDLSYGILACNPFDDEPEILYVPLPKVVDELPVNPANRGVYSCLKVSGGRLRYLQIHGTSDAPVVTMWALTDPPCAAEWNHERSVPLSDIWTDPNYLDTKLPWSIPALALLHPTDPDKVYFFLSSYIFAVDLRLKKVVECNGFVMPGPPSHMKLSSHFVHAWKYDPSYRRGFLPKCFKENKVSLDPKYKKMTQATPVTTPVIPVTTPVIRVSDNRLKRFRDHDHMVMEEQLTKRMKLEAMMTW